MKGENGKNVSIENGRTAKKTYHSPKLSHFGTVAHLTLKSGMGPINDSGMNMMAAS